MTMQHSTRKPEISNRLSQIVSVLENNFAFYKAVSALEGNQGEGKIILMYKQGRLQLVDVSLSLKVD